MSIADNHSATSDPALAALTATILEILDDWQLSPEQQLHLLGMDAQPGGQMMRFRNGTVLPQDPNTKRRIKALLTISSGLNHIMPHTPDAGAAWLHGESSRFGGKSPLGYLMANDLDGLELVASVISGASDSPWG